MENTQAAPHAGQVPEEPCAHEQQENYKPEEYKMAGPQEAQMMGASAPMNGQQFYGQGSGITASAQAPQMGPQTMTSGMGGPQFQGTMGQPAGVGQGMSEGHHDSGENCACQGGMEGYTYGNPPVDTPVAPMMPPSFTGQQGMPQMGPVGQPQFYAAMNGGCADQFGHQPAQAGPMAQRMPLQYGPMAAPPYAPMMPGMPGQGHVAPQYGPQMPFQPPMPTVEHSCGGSGHTEHGAHGHSAQQPLHDQHQYQYQYGQLMDIVGDMMAGNPDVSKIMGFFQSCDAQFLKGVLVGAVGMFLLTNDTVKSMIVDMISGVWGTFQKEKDVAEEEPPEAEPAPTKTTRSRRSKTTEK